ncbi:MAG: phosphatase PAP2 family protein [bacterium]
MNTNTKLFFNIHNLSGKSRFLDVFSYIGAKYVIFFMTILYVFLCLIFFPMYGRVVYPVIYPLNAFILSWLVGLLISLLIGKMARRPRPYITYSDKVKKKFSAWFSWKSFPSDHAFTAFLFFFSAMIFSVPFYWIFLPLALWVGWGRVYCGVHYPLDIAGGFILAGLMIGTLFLL